MTVEADVAAEESTNGDMGYTVTGEQAGELQLNSGEERDNSSADHMGFFTVLLLNRHQCISFHIEKVARCQGALAFAKELAI